MEKKSFFKTKEGGLTVAFAVIILAFILMLTGLKQSGDGMCIVGFALMVIAMLYSPLKVFVLDRIKK